MSEVLTCRRGLVVVLEGCGGIPGKLILDGFQPQAAIITSPMIDQRVNVQFQTSLKEAVYAYVFGDNMGKVGLSGTAFAGRCNDEETSGLKDLFNYYGSYRASKRSETVSVTFGAEAMTGFLTSMYVTAQDPKFMTMNFSLGLNTLPKKGGS